MADDFNSKFGKFGPTGGFNNGDLRNPMNRQENQSRIANQRMDRLSSQELEMVRKYANTRAANKRPLKYDSLQTFSQSHPAKFTRLSRPQITFKGRYISFSTSAILAFEGLPYVIFWRDDERKKLAVQPIAEEELSSHPWARKKDEKWMPRPISCEDYLDELYEVAGWERYKTYKALAEITETPYGLVLMFDLAEAFDVPRQKVEVTDPVTGEIRHKQIKNYPEKYQNGGGLSFNEYQASRKSKVFDSLEGFSGGGMLISSTQEKRDLEELMTQLEKKNTDSLSDKVREALERFGATSDTIKEEQFNVGEIASADQEQYAGGEQMEMHIGSKDLYTGDNHATADSATVDMVERSFESERMNDDQRDEQVRNE